MKKITFFVFLSAFFLLRPYNFSMNGLMYSGDDWSYFSHASALAFGEFPSYSKESFSVGSGVPAHSAGSGIMAAPFVFVFAQLDRFSGRDIFLKRTPENVRGSWSQFGFVFATSFYFWTACLLLFLTARMYVSPGPAAWAVITMVLAQGTPLVVFRRPVFSHVYELVLASFLVWMLARVIRLGHVLTVRNLCVIGISCGMVLLTRLNNVFFVPVFPVVLAVLSHRGASLRKKFLAASLMLFLAAVTVFVFKFWPESLVSQHSLHAVDHLLASAAPWVYLRRVWHILAGPDWGLVYTAPVLLLAGLGQFFYSRRDLAPFKWVSLLLLVNFWVVMQWMTQGGWYGYRYLIFSAMPLLIVSWSVILAEKVFVKSPWPRVLLAVGLVQPLVSMLFFEGNAKGLSLSAIEQYFGVAGWGNNFYQSEIWKLVFAAPAQAAIALFRGGALYLLFLLGCVFPAGRGLFVNLNGLYPVFDWMVLLRTLILYGLPFVMYFLWRRFARDSSFAE